MVEKIVEAVACSLLGAVMIGVTFGAYMVANHIQYGFGILTVSCVLAVLMGIVACRK